MKAEQQGRPKPGRGRPLAACGNEGTYGAISPLGLCLDRANWKGELSLLCSHLWDARMSVTLHITQAHGSPAYRKLAAGWVFLNGKWHKGSFC